MTSAQLREQIRKAKDEIDAAYWTFTRCARGVPPAVAVPDAYRRKREAEAELERRRARRRGKR